MRRMIAAAILAGTSVMAQRPATTVQQDFERATQLSNGQDKPSALAAWQALEKRVAGNKRNLGIVLVRKSDILFQLGDKDQAIAAARAGLAELPAGDRTLDDDRFQAYQNLGQFAEATLDYAGAADYYRLALALAFDPVGKLAALRGLIQTEIFTDLDKAGLDLDAADRILASVKVDKSVIAIFERLHGKYLLARGRFAEAQQADRRAVEDLGGLTGLTHLDDVSARSDYAIAALLAGHPDDAREYMALTGAGRLPQGEFDPGVQIKVPECGGDANLKPDDAAVIEFSIGDNGNVISSEPVYAAGGGEAALAFARAAQDWSWTPEQIKKLAPFFRYNARVELRCSTAFERPSLATYLNQELGNWLDDKRLPSTSPILGSDAAALPKLRTRLAAQQAVAGPDALELVPTMVAIAENSVAGREESNRMATRALAIVEANGASPIAQLAVERLVWTTSQAETWRSGVFNHIVAPHLDDAVYTNAPTARAALRILLADEGLGHDSALARPLLQQVADDPALDDHNPLKIGALIRLASLDVNDGKPDLARATFARTGLSGDQCALLDAPPKFVSSRYGSEDFPREALRWGFEGWTKVQFDIDADGRVRNTRAIASYPPFVFTKAGTGVIGEGRYQKSFRPAGGLGCSGQAQQVKFVLPFK